MLCGVLNCFLLKGETKGEPDFPPTQWYQSNGDLGQEHGPLCSLPLRLTVCQQLLAQPMRLSHVLLAHLPLARDLVGLHRPQYRVRASGRGRLKYM